MKYACSNKYINLWEIQRSESKTWCKWGLCVCVFLQQDWTHTLSGWGSLQAAWHTVYPPPTLLSYPRPPLPQSPLHSSRPHSSVLIHNSRISTLEQLHDGSILQRKKTFWCTKMSFHSLTWCFQIIRCSLCKIPTSTTNIDWSGFGSNITYYLYGAAVWVPVLRGEPSNHTTISCLLSFVHCKINQHYNEQMSTASVKRVFAVCSVYRVARWVLQ